MNLKTIAILSSFYLFLSRTPESETSKSTIKFISFEENKQEFNINSDSLELIELENGTRLTIKPGSFMDKNGRKISGPVKLQAKEVFEVSSMIMNGLSTTSNGKILESGGMVYIQALSNNDTLTLLQPILVQIPNLLKIDEAEIFRGYSTEQGFINWELVNYENDTTFNTRMIITFDYGYDAVVEKTLRVLNQDTIELDSTIVYDEDLDTAAVVYNRAPEFFYSSIDKLGWINIDKFKEIENQSELNILSNIADTYGYLIFKNQRTVLPLKFTNSQFSSEELPANIEAIVVLFATNQEGNHFYKQSITLGRDTSIDARLKQLSEQDLIEQLSELDELNTSD